MCLFSGAFFLNRNSIFTFKPVLRKPAFIEVTSFKSLFLVTFQAFGLDETHHLLVKRFLQKRL